MKGKSDFILGIYQPQASVSTPQQRIQQLARALEQPAAKDCDLMVCPELFISGYFVNDEIKASTQEMQGAFSEAIASLAQQHECAIVYGYPERQGEQVFNSALCIGKNGALLGNHRKTLLPHDYEKRYFQPGEQATSINVAGWKIGIVICYEVEFPESVRYHARTGCDIVVAPTALTHNWPVVARQLIPTRAFENGIFVAYANHAGEENGNLFLGESVIVSPDGNDLARANNQQMVISARLEHLAIENHRDRLPFLRDVENSRYQL